ncbi:MAG: hypothetical protein ACI4Q8_03075 [Ruminococcus sp.]
MDDEWYIIMPLSTVGVIFLGIVIVTAGGINGFLIWLLRNIEMITWIIIVICLIASVIFGAVSKSFLVFITSAFAFSPLVFYLIYGLFCLADVKGIAQFLWFIAYLIYGAVVVAADFGIQIIAISDMYDDCRGKNRSKWKTEQKSVCVTSSILGAVIWVLNFLIFVVF